MKSEEKNLDNAQKLMLLQGISLMHDGLQFVHWSEMPNALSFDALMILTDRFHFFQQCVLDGSTDHLMIDKLRDRIGNVKYGYALNQEIQKQLEELREIVMSRQHKDKTENK